MISSQPRTDLYSSRRSPGRIAGALFLASVGLLVGCDRSGSQQAGPGGMERPPALVTAAPAITRDVPVYLDEIGRCAAVESVSIQPQIGGRVEKVHFVEGADVKKGDLLFTIDARPFEAALALAEATLAQSRENLHLAHLEFKRVEGLQESNAISQFEYDQKKSGVAVNEALVSAEEAAVRTAKLNLEYCTIRSPIDGRTGQVLVTAGNVVKSSEATLVMIQKVDPMYADFTITESELPRVRQQMRSGALRVEVSLPSRPIYESASAAATRPADGSSSAPSAQADDLYAPRTGELTMLDNSVQQVTGTVKLRATLPNADRHFWPGQFVKVRLVLSVKKDAVLVPSQAAQVGQKGPFVYVIKPDNTAELRPIKPGQPQGDLLVIEQGVNAGENVIVTGQMTIMPGSKVMVAPPPGVPASAGMGGGAPIPATSQPAKSEGAKS